MLIIITLLQTVANQQPPEFSIAPLVIQQTDGERCLPQLQREKARLTIRNNVTSILSKLDIIDECGGGLWYKVAHLNMSDPTEQCPSAWRLYSTNGVRACGRPATSSQSRPATFYPTGRQYSKVCGRVIGYQISSPGAFYAVISPPPSSLDDTYVDGVSITYGNPRKHIWTYAAGVTEGTLVYHARPDCPCARSGATPAPSYVGENYYCESGNPATTFILNSHLYRDDPLWDGQQCEGQCCSGGKSPPWFKVDLTNPTSDDIEVRICGDESTSNEDTPIKLLEIYVS